MEQSITATIKEYDRTQDEQFFTSELQSIMDISTDTFSLIVNALKYGYMRGYDNAKREEKAKI